jgi:hypothetical protein
MTYLGQSGTIDVDEATGDPQFDPHFFSRHAQYNGWVYKDLSE